MNEGQEFEQTFKITNAIFDGFTELFQDRNPMHMDRDFANRHGFTDRVVYGNVLNGFLSYFIGECLPVKNVVILAQTIKFNKPVYSGDTLAFKAIVDNYSEAFRVIDFKFEFVNQHNQKVSKGTIQIKQINA